MEDLIMTELNTVSSPSDWKRCTEKPQISKLKSGMDDTVTVGVMSSRVVLKEKDVEKMTLKEEKWKKQNICWYTSLACHREYCEYNYQIGRKHY